MASSDGHDIGAWPTDNPAGPAAPRSGSLPPGGTGVPELVSLLLTTRSVEEFLTGLAAAAAELLTVSCGITMRRNSESLTVASSDALAAAVDEVQYGKGEGPCLQALATGQVISVPDLAARSVIDQAIGIVMGQQGCNASTASPCCGPPPRLATASCGTSPPTSSPQSEGRSSSPSPSPIPGVDPPTATQRRSAIRSSATVLPPSTTMTCPVT